MSKPLYLYLYLVPLAAGSLSLSTGCRSGFEAAGSTCSVASECETPLACLSGVCVDPKADPDGDGLSNAAEETLGTDPSRYDTDGDRRGDGEEGTGDSDGDGIVDALESAIADADLDCVADQFDADNFTPTTAELAAAQLCARLGVCADQAGVAVTCTHAPQSGQNIVAVTCDYSAITGFESPQENSCDGLDNDCDGLVDEGLAYRPSDGAPVLVGDTCSGIGACGPDIGTAECAADGTVTCSVNAKGSTPKGAPESSCNGVDDDCNGIVDDGQVWLDPHSGQARRVGESCQGRGVCGLGVVQCADDGSEARCSTEPGGSADESLAEACDGLDNDCDGDTDEGLAYVQPDGASVPLGASCGLGACAGGVVACSAGLATCTTASLAQVGEWCNGEDDDCDGQVDEPPSLALNCPQKGTGVCDKAIPISAFCGDGLAPLCGYGAASAWQADETLCDGLDNDCDGEVDEALVWNDADGNPLALDAACTGLGACADSDAGGIVTCSGGIAVCSANVGGGGVELCNGLDDDCDGFIDEIDPTLPGGGVCKTLGICADWVSTVPACASGQWVCGYDQDPVYEAVETLCDGIDNDCDGLVDENAAKTFSGAPTAWSAGQPMTRQWNMVPGEDAQAWQVGGLYLHQIPLSDVWRFDLNEVAWEPMPPLPVPTGAAAVTYSPSAKALLVHGGVSTPVDIAPDLQQPFGGVMTPVQAMRLFDTSQNKWLSVTQQVSSDLPTDEVTLARAFHAMCALPDGRVVLSGGRTASGQTVSKSALVGTLSASSSNNWSITWEPLADQPANRLGHRLLCLDDGSPTVVAVGGVGTDGIGVGFVEATRLDAPDQSWSTVAGPPSGSTHRLMPVAAIDKSAVDLELLIHGGFAIPEQGNVAVSQALSGGWRLPLAQALDGQSVTWAAQEVWAGIPAQGGGGLQSFNGRWYRLGGSTGAGYTWRSLWSVDPASVVPAEKHWNGVAPRFGGTLVTAAKTGTTYLLCGARDRAGTLPLQDAYSTTAPDVGFQLQSQPSPPLLGSATTTRPDVSYASGVWDPVSKRVLLSGGVRPDGAPSAKLWSYGSEPSVYQSADAQGDKPAAAFRPVFSLDPNGSVAWLFGAHATAPDPQAGPWFNAPFDGSVWSLELSSSTWTQLDLPAGPQPWGTRAAGGMSPAGLDAAVLGLDGTVTLWHFDPATLSWTDLAPATALPGPASPPSPSNVNSATPELATEDRMGAFAYDPLSRRALVTIHAPGAAGITSASVWEADFVAGTFTLRDSVVPGADGGAMALHPSLGLLAFAGAEPGASAVLWQVPQACVADKN